MICSLTIEQRPGLSRARPAAHRDQLSGTANHFHLAPEVFARTGAVAVVALVAVPIAAFAGRRRWAAFVLGGSLVVLGLTLVPAVFSDLMKM